YDVYVRASRADDPYPTPFQPDELRVLLSRPSTFERWEAFAGRSDSGEVLAAGQVVLPLADNIDKADVTVWVDPSHRRQGYGSELAGQLVDYATDSGRSTLLTSFSCPTGADESHPSRAFAVKLGFTFANSEAHRILDLPVPEPRLDALLASAAPYHNEYTLHDYVDDDIPAGLVPSFLDLVNALMIDAPTGAVEFEAGRLTETMFRANTELMQAQGRTTHRTLAVDARGEAVAHTELVVGRNEPDKIFQWATLVRRDHRGRRLGLATKTRNLKTVQARYPDRSVVHTWNSESNRHMIAVNEAMGFRVVGALAEYQRKSRPPGGGSTGRGSAPYDTPTISAARGAVGRMER
ncbi:MAG: GNAT family N-acetyltransferase, partial [Nocardioidaceae bacterium]